MSKNKEGKNQQNKKAPLLNLKEKREAKAAKRRDKDNKDRIIISPK